MADNVVYNMDVIGIYERLNRFIEEVTKAVSSNLSLTNEFDIGRLQSYLDSVDRYHAWIVAQPQMDLPETSPRAYTLKAPPPEIEIENEDMDDCLRQLRAARDEIINSQSARMPAGLIKPDSLRLTACIAKTRAFLADYVLPTQPLDLPESTPAQPMSGAGRTGA